jgi:hypothetical protein
MSNGGGTFFERLLVALFAAGVVALGANELNSKFGNVRAAKATDLTQDLLGATNIKKGQFSIEKSMIAAKENSNATDKLGSTEKHALQDLIDSVSKEE